MAPHLAAVDGGLLLLHSRYPAWQREEITRACEQAFGKPRPDDPGGRRPRTSILVATQIVEQSLDLDFDFIVSDLAPLAQLLQRAGRAMRHDRDGRPGWLGKNPRLVVLEPIGDGGAVAPPVSWGTVYDTSLLLRTSQLLRARTADGIAVPGDVQHLVDEVYAHDFGDRLADAARRELERFDVEREVVAIAEHQLAQLAAIPPPDGLIDLARLSGDEGMVDEELVTTRLGADSERAVCAYAQPGGKLTLDPEGERPLPGHGGGRLTTQNIREVMRHTVPLPGRWLAERGPEHEPPAAWGDRPVLGRLVLLPMRRTGDGRWVCRVGDQALEISGIGIQRF